MDEAILKCRDNGNRHPDWDRLYREQAVESMPWFYPILDPDVRGELARRKLSSGALLDIGCGSGEQAALLHTLGFQVTGTDISPAAVAAAKLRHPNISFFTDDILRTELTSQFIYILDRGCFHVLPEEAEPAYASALHKLCAAEGIVLLKCFSSDEPARDFGPRRFSEDSIKKTFSPLFRLDRIVHTVFQGNNQYQPRAIFVALIKE